MLATPHRIDLNRCTHVRVLLELLVSQTVKEADFRLVLCIAGGQQPNLASHPKELTETEFGQRLGIVIKYPLVVIEVDDEIRRLQTGSLRAS